MKGIVGVLTFIAGVAAGSVATYLITSKRYEKIIDEEIASVKETYAKRFEKLTIYDPFADEEDNEDEEDNSEIEKEYTQMINDLKYSSDDERTNVNDKPYVISPELYREHEDEGYDSVNLTFYADGILAFDDDMDVVEDIEETVGVESLSHFGEYEDDSVFIRNDKLKYDAEILLDPRKYSDVIKQPYYKGKAMASEIGKE